MEALLHRKKGDGAWNNIHGGMAKPEKRDVWRTEWKTWELSQEEKE